MFPLPRSLPCIARGTLAQATPTMLQLSSVLDGVNSPNPPPKITNAISHTQGKRKNRKEGKNHPITHNSTPSTPNFSPSSLNGSFPNVSHRELRPASSESSSQSP